MYDCGFFGTIKHNCGIKEEYNYDRHYRYSHHILFQVDDGSPSLKTSIDILKKEYSQGVRNVICTPHYHAGECMPEGQLIEDNFQVLKKEAKEIIPEMNLFLGNEIMACNDMAQMLSSGELFTLAQTNYVLVEFYPTVIFSANGKIYKFIAKRRIYSGNSSL